MDGNDVASSLALQCPQYLYSMSAGRGQTKTEAHRGGALEGDSQFEPSPPELIDRQSEGDLEYWCPDWFLSVDLGHPMLGRMTGAGRVARDPAPSQKRGN